MRGSKDIQGSIKAEGKEMAAKNKDHTRRPRGGAHQASPLQPCFPLHQTRMLRAVTQRTSCGPQRSGLRLRHNHSGNHNLYDGPGTTVSQKLTWFVVDW